MGTPTIPSPDGPGSAEEDKRFLLEKQHVMKSLEMQLNKQPLHRDPEGLRFGRQVEDLKIKQ